jgi:hypothetical protein
MTDPARRLAICHLLLRGDRWIPVSVNKKLGPNARCSPGGPVITATLCAVLEVDTIIGWLENSAFMVREIEVDGSLAPLDLAPTARAVDAKYFDMKAAEAGVVGISSLIAKRRVQEQNTGKLSSELREAAFERATVQILDKLQVRSVVGVLLLEQ